MHNKKPKIVIIGAGSLYFGRKAIWAASHLEGLRGCTLSLVDTDPQRLDKLVRFAHLVAKDSGSGTTVEAHTDFRFALPQADYVVLSFSTNNVHYRRIDCALAAKYGIRMCSGDTIGPGGVFRTLRDFPKALEIAHAMEEVCPDAWLINYINPTATMGIGLMRHSRIKSFALCDSHHMPHKKLAYLKMIGEPDSSLRDLDMRIAGVNHFTWMISATLKGKDILPDIREAFRQLSIGEKDQGYAKGRFNNFITAQLSDTFNAIPTCTGHTKEYVPYYQGRSSICEPVPPLSVFDCDERDERTHKMWEEIDDYLSGKASIESFQGTTQSDHATDIIRTMVTGGDQSYFINRSNQQCTQGGGKAVANLPEDAFLEMECLFVHGEPRPLPVGSFPIGLRAQQMTILDVHELTIEAVMKKDHSLLTRALAMDPLVNSIATARALLGEFFIQQREVLSDWPDIPADPFQQLDTPHLAAKEAPVLY